LLNCKLFISCLSYHKKLQCGRGGGELPPPSDPGRRTPQRHTKFSCLLLRQKVSAPHSLQEQYTFWILCLASLQRYLKKSCAWVPIPSSPRIRQPGGNFGENILEEFVGRNHLNKDIICLSNVTMGKCKVLDKFTNVASVKEIFLPRILKNSTSLGIFNFHTLFYLYFWKDFCRYLFS